MTMPEFSRDACGTCGRWAEWFCDEKSQFCLVHAPAEADGWLHRIGVSRPTPSPSKPKVDDQWMRPTWAVLLNYLHHHDRFFVDDLWNDEPRFDRSIGVVRLSKVIERAFNEGLIERSGERRVSVINNNVEKPVWTSMIYQGVLA